MNRRTLLGVAVLLAVAVGAVSLLAGTGFDALAMTAPTGAGTVSSAPELAFERDANTGINYTSTFSSETSMIGDGGVYVTDYDGDNWPDLLLTGDERPVLYENTGGTFVESGALPPVEGTVRAAHVLDYDVDGDEDLLLLRSGAAPVFLENTGGAFERASVGLSDLVLAVPTGATSADYNGDGCPDLFVYQNGDWASGFPGNSANRQAVLNGSARPTVTDGNPNYLLRGTCDGFVNATARTGIRGEKWTLAASFVDLTDDGRPDIHVANDFSHDVLYVNEANGSFRRVDLGRSTDRNAMSSEIADVTGDGRPDVFVTNIYFREGMTLRSQGGRQVSITKSSLSLVPEGNNLLVNRGNGSFADRAPAFEVRKGGWGWAASISDLDNDGHRDLIHATSSEVPIIEYDSLGYESPMVWAGTAEGFAARNATALGFEETNGRGLVAVDYDRDGDLDLVVGTAATWTAGRVAQEPFAVYENVGASDRSRFLSIERDGATALGARVTVATNETTRYRVVTSRTDFLSQEPRTLHVGLGNETIERIRVVWPDGTERTFSTLPEGRFLEVTPEGIRAVRFDTE